MGALGYQQRRCIPFKGTRKIPPRKETSTWCWVSTVSGWLGKKPTEKRKLVFYISTMCEITQLPNEFRSVLLLMEEIPNNHLGCVFNPVNNGIFTISTGEFTGFLNHQQYEPTSIANLHKNPEESTLFNQKLSTLSGLWEPVFCCLRLFQWLFLVPLKGGR